MSMELLSLSCNHCGAPLEAPKSANYLSCQHCGSRLKIMSSGGAAWTEVQEKIEAIAERQDDMAQDLEIIKLHNQIEALERDWDRYRDKSMIRSKHGREREPSVGGGMFSMIVGIVGGLVFFAMSGGAGAPMPFPLFGLAFVAFGVFSGLHSMKTGKAFERSKQRFQSQRRSLQGQIRRASHTDS
ncbi:MAG: hypothetical protein PF961_22965 [Planctomycetota bacterium]|jgi:DNA-directed RNA polymerase subunit RPC12/RpoP|nr:hypothetical protein [Planctomycetota bacterium]